MTFRWVVSDPSALEDLCLVNMTTKECVAKLEAAALSPWSKLQQQITISSGQEDPIWVQVVVASGLAAADRLGTGNAWIQPKRRARYM